MVKSIADKGHYYFICLLWMGETSTRVSHNTLGLVTTIIPPNLKIKLEHSFLTNECNITHLSYQMTHYKKFLLQHHSTAIP